MELKKVFLKELHPALYNPRVDLQPEDLEYQQIKRSIEEFGYVDPVIINSDNTIIGGHQRVKVLQEMGYSTIDVIQVDLDKVKEKALNVALNKIEGKWEPQKLDSILQDLKGLEFDISITGFNEIDLAFDPNDEWKGMPDYLQDDLSGIKLIVHFENEEDRQDFAKLVGQKLNKMTKYIWYPKKEWDDEKAYQYKVKE